MKSIILTGDAPRLVLEGKKTQSRCVIKPQPPAHHWEAFASNPLADYELSVKLQGGVATWTPRHRVRGGTWHSDEPYRRACPFAVGDKVWVKETWSTDHAAFYPHFPVVYAADKPVEIENGFVHSPEHNCRFSFRWRSPVTMPQWRSRLTLEITEIRCERLNAITEEDAQAEGFKNIPWGTWWQGYRELNGELFHSQHRGDAPPDFLLEPKRMQDRPDLDKTALRQFQWAWNKANRAHPWESNPFVWVRCFQLLSNA